MQKKKKKASLPSTFVFTWPNMPWELLKSPRSHEAVNWAFKISKVPFRKAKFTSSQIFLENLFTGTCGKDSNSDTRRVLIFYLDTQ
jgi:hypothetical protein